jgi:hypothetical protein
MKKKPILDEVVFILFLSYITVTDLQNLHIKLKIEQHEPQIKPVVNSGASEGLVVPAPLVVLVELI